jgi:hypothetical protein
MGLSRNGDIRGVRLEPLLGRELLFGVREDSRIFEFH